MARPSIDSASPIPDLAPATAPTAASTAAATAAATAATASHAGAMSLEGMHDSVPLPPIGSGFWRTLRAFVGPALLISVGYMDPGNWGTDLAAGGEYRYALLWVVGLASAMAVVLQVLAARLGVVTGKDLAQCQRDWYPAWTRVPNWILAEVAIGACDLAEVLGAAVALNLLFGIPVLWAVVLTAADVLVLLGLQRLGMRKIEAVVLVLVGTIAACFFVEIFVLPTTRPNFGEMGHALTHPRLAGGAMLTVAIGIIGATVMPHNLYLHSALVQTRRVGRSDAGIARAVRFNSIDAVLSLSIAFVINAAILVLAAVAFHGKAGVTVPGGHYVKFDDDTDWINIAYLTLAPLLGAAAAGTLFAVALLASGQSSTITGTLAGQVVMEGFLHWRLAPWLRRVVTRGLAVLPAVVVIWLKGAGSVNDLLVLSQVVLAVQLPFAMFPLLHFTTSRRRTGRWAAGWPLTVAGWGSAILITAMDVWGLPDLCRSVAGMFRATGPG